MYKTEKLNTYYRFISPFLRQKKNDIFLNLNSNNCDKDDVKLLNKN